MSINIILLLIFKLSHYYCVTMYCQNHPNKESVTSCVVCGKPICNECLMNIAGESYCHECVAEIVATEAPKRTKSRQTRENDSNKDLEEKYEKYLDDLYYKDKEKTNNYNGNDIANNENNHRKISLKEQLARDEARYGSIIKKPRKPTEPTPYNEFTNHNVEKSNLKSITMIDENNENRRSLHSHIHSERQKKKEEESTTTELTLTIILIFMIILVASYIIYLFTLTHIYPSYFDAIFTLFSNPAELIKNIFSGAPNEF